MGEAAIMRSCLVGARGWEHAGWAGDFYPDDLPDDWRLGYYANEVSVVLVPGPQWSRASSAELEAWCDDTSDGFRFYLEAPDPSVSVDAYLSRLERVAQVLAGRLGGLLYRRQPSVDEYRRGRRLLGQSHLHIDASVTVGSGPWPPSVGEQVACLSAEGMADLVSLRKQIQRLGEKSTGDLTLFFPGQPPDLALMRQSILLTQLLGYA